MASRAKNLFRNVKINRHTGLSVDYSYLNYKKGELSLKDVDLMVSDFGTKLQNTRIEHYTKYKSSQTYMDRPQNQYEKPTYQRQRLYREMKAKNNLKGLYHAVRTVLWQKTRFRG